MDIQVRCDCGRVFLAPPSLAGGLTNCPQCGQATKVEGLRDPAWRLMQFVALAVWVLVVAFTFTNWGLGTAAIVGLSLGAFYALVMALL